MNYVIKPLLLSQLPVGEKGFMTYLAYYGQSIMRPYVMWFVEGNEKRILVDTAIEARDYQNCFPTLKRFPFKHIQTFEEALAKVNCQAEDIDIVIQTHLHIDHVFNTQKCINAKVYVQEEELRFARDPHPMFEMMYLQEIIEGLNFEILKGDQTILPGIDVLFVPGHTPGCQAVAIQTKKGKVIISGFCSIMDNFYPPENVQLKVSPFASSSVIIPGIHIDPLQAYESILKIKRTADIIIPLHDPEMATKVRIP